MPPNTGPVESHRDVEYVVTFHPDQATLFHVAATADRREVHIHGVCPGCRGRTATVWTLGSGDGQKGIFTESAAKSRARIPDRTRLVICDCGHTHANRPDTAPFHGCGANWLIELP